MSANLSSSRGPRAPRALAAGLALAVGLGGCGPEAPARSDDPGVPGAARVADEPTASSDDRPAVVFLGNSLTAGLGVDPIEAFPALLQRRIDEADLGFRVVNAGISGETTGGGLRRVGFLLDHEPAVLVIGLGGNDALRGVPPDRTQRNIQLMIDEARGRFPDLPIVILGMLAPPNMGDEYADRFAAVFPAVASSNDATLVPFLLEGVAADPELNQPDGIHPTAAGHAIIASTVWSHLEPVLRSAAGAR